MNGERPGRPLRARRATRNSRFIVMTRIRERIPPSTPSRSISTPADCKRRSNNPSLKRPGGVTARTDRHQIGLLHRRRSLGSRTSPHRDSTLAPPKRHAVRAHARQVSWVRRSHSRSMSLENSALSTLRPYIPACFSSLGSRGRPYPISDAAGMRHTSHASGQRAIG